MSTQGSAPALAAFSDDVANIVERVGASVVALQARRSYPASAILLEPGVIATAAHTLRREDGITAVLADGSASAATLVGVDPGTDVAVLRLESQSADGGAARLPSSQGAGVQGTRRTGRVH